jgi:quinol monooxygenase YgiN
VAVVDVPTDPPSADPRVVVHARFVARPGQGEVLLAEVGRMLDAARDEPGTLAYAVHRDRDQPDAVVVYEVYDGDAGLEAHGASAAAARFGPLLDDLLAEPVIAWSTHPVAATGVEDLLGLPPPGRG